MMTARSERARPAGTGAPEALPLARLLDAAARSVAAVRAGRSLTDALGALDDRTRPGAQALAFHTLRWLGGAEAARAALAPRTPPPALDALLLVALALLRPQTAPAYEAHTVVDQAVACARRQAPASAGFVNAVLRRYLRERDTLVARLEQSERADPTARWQHPRWWVERLQRDWPQAWSAILQADQQAAPMVLRVHARATDVGTALAALAAAGMAGRPVGPHAIELERPAPVQRLPGFADGLLSVQDRSAQLAAPLLLGDLGGWPRLPAGARVLDACAAPGGKTAHLLELADLEVTAVDADAGRLARVADTLARVGRAMPLPPVRRVAADAGDAAAWWDGRPFDAILLDAPCSASGIVRRHPDVRWLRRESDIEALARIQAGLLDRLWPLLAPGGRLVYATCSVFRAEGEDQIAAFLQRTPGARRVDAPGHLLPLADNADSAAAAGDGFFYAGLVRTA